MKRCSKCKVEHPVSFFSRNKTTADGLQFWCKTCSRQAIQPQTETRRAKLLELAKQFKNKPCMDCGGQYPAVAMDFDHRPDEEKLFSITRAYMDNYSDEEILAEIEKCDLVCANCHRVRTAIRHHGGVQMLLPL